MKQVLTVMTVTHDWTCLQFPLQQQNQQASAYSPMTSENIIIKYNLSWHNFLHHIYSKSFVFSCRAEVVNSVKSEQQGMLWIWLFSFYILGVKKAGVVEIKLS